MNFSITEAHRRYIDYHCYGNKLHTSKEDMAAIVQQYRDKLSQWQTKACENDDNKYEFDDSDFENWKAEGKKSAQDKTGYEGTAGQKAGEIAYSCGDAALAAGGAGLNVAHGGIKALGNVKNGNIFSNGAKAVETTKEITTKTGEVTTKTVKGTADGHSWSAYLTAAIAIASAILYWIAHPNKEQKEACDKLQEVMGESQSDLAETQGMMENMAEEIENASAEAQEANEEANDNIETSKAEYDIFAAIRKAIEDKKASGEELTENDIALYETASQGMVESGDTITETQDDAETTVGEIYDDIGTYQEGYDTAAETMGNIEGITDYAENMDVNTKNMCYVEGIGQTLNAASGAMAGARLIATAGLNVGQYVLGGAAIAAAVSSGFAAAEQFSWASQVGVEIDARKNTQDFNGETMEIYDQEIDNYENTMGDVADLELEIPDDTEAPDTMTINVPETKTEAPKTEDPNKKKEEKEQ